MSSPVPTTTPTDGAVLVRVAAPDPGWVRRLPRVPSGMSLTVTVGHDELFPVPADELVAGGYRVVGVASERRPIGWSVDVFVPLAVRQQHPGWFARLTANADRVFDLRHGPVLRVLATEIDLHLRHQDG